MKYLNKKFLSFAFVLFLICCGTIQAQSMDTTKVTATKNKEKKNSDTLQGSKSKADRNKAAMEIYMHPPAHLIKQANENAKSKEKTKISK